MFGLSEIFEEVEGRVAELTNGICYLTTHFTLSKRKIKGKNRKSCLKGKVGTLDFLRHSLFILVKIPIGN